MTFENISGNDSIVRSTALYYYTGEEEKMLNSVCYLASLKNCFKYL